MFFIEICIEIYFKLLMLEKVGRKLITVNHVISFLVIQYM